MMWRSNVTVYEVGEGDETHTKYEKKKLASEHDDRIASQ